MTQANSYETKMHMDREYIIHMLKYGKQDEIDKTILINSSHSWNR